MADIRVIFVLPDSANDVSDASQIMIQAYDSCKQLVNNISWTKEADLSTMKFTKLDYLVFENFEGKDFTKFIECKCAVLGPLAISVCLIEGKPIPNFHWPIFNVALYGCEVTCSQLSKKEKEDIQNKVQLMGGFYSADLRDSVTHLICGGTKSEKYILAAEKGAKLMLPEWISHVFELSQARHVNGDDLKIVEKFKCPPFHKLTICSTGITSTKEKKRMAEIISANGGTLAASLVLSKTDVLICHGPQGFTSAKYKAAIKTPHIMCLPVQWIFDSVEQGYALPAPNELSQNKPATSTPEVTMEKMDPNFSTISAIDVPTLLRKTTIDETVNTTSSDTPVSKRVNNKRKAEDDLVEKIDMKKAKMAGHFLDGCSVYVVGFNQLSRDKLYKIINIGGATRYDSFSERVSHVIVGDPTCPEVEAIRKSDPQCYLLSIEWLLVSLNLQKAAREEEYLITRRNLNLGADRSGGSPLSKKGLNFLSECEQPTLTDVSKVLINEDQLTEKYLKNYTAVDEEEDTFAKLLNQQGSQTLEGMLKDGGKLIDFRPNTTSTQVSKANDTSTQISQVTQDLTESEVDVSPFFRNCKFFLDGFDEENVEIFKTCIINAGGTVTKDAHCDFAILPVVYKPVSWPNVTEVLNEIWLRKCIEDSTLCNDIQYYHRPIDLPTTCSLQDCVITISGYTGEEREFLTCVIEGLGGIFQEQFSRNTSKAKNVVASTHLISAEPRGKKYEAAVRWNLPVVSKIWLLECAKTGKREPLENFAVGKENCETNESHEVNHNQNGQSTPHAIKAVHNFDIKNTPGVCSQITPVKKILEDAFNSKVLPPPPSPQTYYPWNPKTPDTPIGAFITPNPSRSLRKEMQKYVNSFPDFVPPKERRVSTPLSELRRKLVNKVLTLGEDTQNNEDELDPPKCDASSDKNAPTENSEVNPLSVENLGVHQKLQELKKVMSSGTSSPATRRSSTMFETASNLPGIEKTNIDVQSQIFTVGWDYGEENSQNPKQKVFLLSGIDMKQRQLLVQQLKDMGAVVLESSNYDPSATHLICPKPGKNEKTLACMAAGKWILHVSYVEKSVAQGHFLNEDEFEFGNPKAKDNIFYEDKESSVYFWRREIKKRGYGAFNDMRAIVVAQKKELITKVIEAGGGIVVNVEPPFDDSIHATHCFLEIKTIKNFSDYEPLAQQGIKCLNTIYINDFLWRSNKDDDGYIIPYFGKFFK